MPPGISKTLLLAGFFIRVSWAARAEIGEVSGSASPTGISAETGLLALADNAVRSVILEQETETGSAAIHPLEVCLSCIIDCR